ncbi:MAG: CHASE2 domain-containing protein [Bryobacteraceae bacterium]|nr:CHASE2 domain-containing protein [Bryobacteraceae bacterium]
MRLWLAAGVSLLAATLLSWTPVARDLDNAAYDWMCRLFPVEREAPQAVVVGVDETLLRETGGMRALRSTLASLLERIAAAEPAVVALDFTLADAGDAAEDARLAAAMRRIPNLVLATDLAQDASGWQDPQPVFAQAAKSLGHVHADPDPVCRWIQLDKAAGTRRRWALAMEALAPGERAEESGDRVLWADRWIPAHRVRIAYSSALPRVRPEDARGKAVFVGATALTAARDRLMTPLGEMMPGVEIHAQLYETLREGRFRTDAPVWAMAALTIAVAVAVVFAVTRWSYAAGAGVVALAHLIPFFAFRADLVVPVSSIATAAWFPGLAAAAWQYFSARRRLDRYQRAIHWVTHEMRTPLTAIQGSSELITRYALPDAKRREIASMINAESKRLSQMVQAFLDVERLSGGQLELKREPVSAVTLIESCVARAAPIAERKRQKLIVEPIEAAADGDRELLEFALYNLITNAIKYSGEETEVRVSAERRNGSVAVAVEDCGMGIAAGDIKKLGTKFFRTRTAEKSGIAGTGIGLSIVQEIVRHHGGKLEVRSAEGTGSCFTMVIPASELGVER